MIALARDTYENVCKYGFEEIAMKIIDKSKYHVDKVTYYIACKFLYSCIQNPVLTFWKIISYYFEI